MSETNRIQLNLAQTLDKDCPAYAGEREAESRAERAEHAVRFAVRECRQANLDQTSVVAIAMRIWREP